MNSVIAAVAPPAEAPSSVGWVPPTAPRGRQAGPARRAGGGAQPRTAERRLLRLDSPQKAGGRGGRGPPPQPPEAAINLGPLRACPGPRRPGRGHRRCKCVRGSWPACGTGASRLPWRPVGTGWGSPRRGGKIPSPVWRGGRGGPTPRLLAVRVARSVGPARWAPGPSNGMAVWRAESSLAVGTVMCREGTAFPVVDGPPWRS
jgi:hypothetical protein